MLFCFKVFKNSLKKIIPSRTCQHGFSCEYMYELKNKGNEEKVLFVYIPFPIYLFQSQAVLRTFSALIYGDPVTSCPNIPHSVLQITN